MNLKGSYKLQAPRSRVWEALNRPDLLRRCTPGCKQFAQNEDGSYNVLMEVGVGSVKGSYAGKIKIADRVPGSQYKLTVTGSGNVGFLNAEGVIQLKDDDGQTLLEYSGQARVGGPIAGVGQRVMDGAARLLVSQFFRCFEKNMFADLAGASEPLETA